ATSCRATCRRCRNRLTVRSGRLKKGNRHRRVPTLAARSVTAASFGAARFGQYGRRAPLRKSRFVNPKSKIGNPKSHLPRIPNAEGNTTAARLERLPLCGFHRRFIGLVSLGSWFDI